MTDKPKKVVPYMINLDETVPRRSKATLLNEITLGLIDLIDVYGKKLSKYGKINRISTCFWPVRLIPLNNTRACVCSYLLNSSERLQVGDFKKRPPPPENVIKASDPSSFLDALRNYNDNYLDTGGFLSSSNFKRGEVVQEALFSTDEVGYFKNFFLNEYDINSFTESYFFLSGDPIAKSVNQIKIAPEIYDFVDLKDVKMLDDYADTISSLCNKWIEKAKGTAEELRTTKVDTRDEEKQLAILNQKLKEEKERDLHATPEELIKTGKYKINDKTGELNGDLESIRRAIDSIKEAVRKSDLFLLDEAMKDINLQYSNLGNSIRRYEKEIAQLKANIDREIADIEKAHQRKISELESKISEVQRKIEDKHSKLSTKTVSAEELIQEIKNEKQAILEKIEEIKDVEMTNVQEFIKNYTIEIKTSDKVVGVPIIIFFFIDSRTKRTNIRIPVLPITIEGGSVQTTKVKEKFRSKLENLMNKYNPVIDLVESEGEKANLMENITNLDTKLDESVNDLRINKILKKKTAQKAKDIINELIW
ncbi:MAG: hypothetical protein BAJALOKI1v1_1900007 [Promethearchaeota archaeon]|nr:MAG: hypothetical protein BAJALOKI1v1_1900007 [Candidatus Lokiarchaeota archaeon]